jgi:hypothetical protein
LSEESMGQLFGAARVRFGMGTVPVFHLSMTTQECLDMFAAEHKRITDREAVATVARRLEEEGKVCKYKESWSGEHATEAIDMVMREKFVDGGVEGLMDSALSIVRLWYANVMTVVTDSLRKVNGKAHSGRSGEKHFAAGWMIMVKYMLKCTDAAEVQLGDPCIGDDDDAPVEVELLEDEDAAGGEDGREDEGAAGGEDEPPDDRGVWKHGSNSSDDESVDLGVYAEKLRVFQESVNAALAMWCFEYHLLLCLDAQTLYFASFLDGPFILVRM